MMLLLLPPSEVGGEPPSSVVVSRLLASAARSARERFFPPSAAATAGVSCLCFRRAYSMVHSLNAGEVHPPTQRTCCTETAAVASTCPR